MTGEFSREATFISYPQEETDPDFLMRLAELKGTGSPVSLSSRVDAPPRSGLGASGALGVAAVACMRALAASSIVPAEIAEEAYQLEVKEMGNAAGRQDQYAAAFGGINLMTFGNGLESIGHQDLPRETILALESSFILVYLHPRTGASGRIMAEENDRVIRGDPQVLKALRLQKVLAVEMARALRSGDLALFGKMLDEAWETKKRQSSLVTNDVVDGVYSLARKAGALGGKLCGAGGGGFMILFAPDRAGPVSDTLRAVGLRPENCVFDFRGLQTW